VHAVIVDARKNGIKLSLTKKTKEIENEI